MVETRFFDMAISEAFSAANIAEVVYSVMPNTEASWVGNGLRNGRGGLDG